MQIKLYDLVNFHKPIVKIIVKIQFPPDSTIV